MDTTDQQAARPKLTGLTTCAAQGRGVITKTETESNPLQRPTEAPPPIDPKSFEPGQQLTFACRCPGGERWFGGWTPHRFDDAS